MPASSDRRAALPGGPIAMRVAEQLSRIAAHDGVYRCFVNVLADEAMAAARELDRVEGDCGSLHGMTVAIKDNIDVAGAPTTAASPAMAGNAATADAAIVARLRRAGAVIIGKANLHEWAIGPTGRSTKAPAAVNAWNPRHISGGSSSGSAVAVAAGFADAAIGSDTGGSVRLPASFNGITGLRPTIGLVSNHGSFPVSARLDTLGPMARTALDVARLLQAIAGHDPRDPFSTDRAPGDHISGIAAPVDGLRIGMPRNWFFDEISAEMKGAADQAIADFERLGARVVEIDLPEAGNAQPMVGLNVVLADAFGWHRDRIARHRELYGDDVLSRLELGASVSPADHDRGLRWMADWRQLLRGVFERVDVILTPTTSGAAPGISTGGAYLDKVRAITRNTYAWSAWGGPTLSLCCGFSGDRLPLGLQLTGRWFGEATVLRLGHAYQDATNHHLETPEPG